MRSYKLFISAMCLCAALVSCSDDKMQQEGILGNALLPFEDVKLHPLGETVKMSFSSANDWMMKRTVEASSEWLSVSPSSGKAGTTEITITVNPCLDEDRMEELMFGSEPLKVSQDRAVLSIDRTTVAVGWQKSKESIDIESNIRWKIQTDGGDWINTGEDYGTGSIHGTDKVSERKSVPLNFVENNVSEAPYTAEITFTPVKYNSDGREDALDANVSQALTRTLMVIQDNLYFKADKTELTSFDCLGKGYIDQQDESFKDAHENHTQTLKVTSEEVWTIAFDDNWGEYKVVGSDKISASGGKELTETTYEVSVESPNPSMENNRENKLIITVTPEAGEPVKKEIRISQDPYKFNVFVDNDIKEKAVFDNSGSAKKSLRIETDGPWNISGLESWLQDVSETQGRGNHEFELNAKGQNLNFDDNKATLSFASSFGHAKNIEVSQDKFIFDIYFNSGNGGRSDRLTLPRLNVDKYEMKIESSGPWSVDVSTTGGDWLSVGKLSGQAEDNSVFVNAIDANPNESQRSKTITVTSNLHKDNGSFSKNDYTRTLTVVQDEYRFNILSQKDGSAFEPSVFPSYKSGSNSQSFYLECGAPWKVVKNPSWIKFDMTEGDGKTYPTVNITADDNTGDDWDKDREEEIVIESDRYLNGTYSEQKSIYVSQEAFVFVAESNCDENNMMSSYKSQSKDNMYIKITTVDGAAWRLESAETWVKTDSNNGKGDKELKLWAENNYGQQRPGTIKVYSEPLNEYFNVPVYQKAYNFKVKTTEFNQFDELDGKAQTLEFECDGDWKIEKPDWIVVKNGNVQGEGNATLSVSAKKNSGGERSGTLKISSGGTNTGSLPVSQRNFLWEVTPEDYNITGVSATDGTEKEYNVSCSGSWTVSSSDNNVVVTPKDNNGNRDTKGSFTITVKPNNETTERNATVTVSSTDFPDVKKEIKISQEKYLWSVTCNDTEFNASDKTSKEIDVKCSGEWEAKSNEAWLTVSPGSANGNGKVTVTASDNTGKEARQGKITVTSKDNPKLTKDITFTQKAK